MVNVLEPASGKEVLFDVADAVVDAAFFLRRAAIAGDDLKAVIAGKVGVERVPARTLAGGEGQTQESFFGTWSHCAHILFDDRVTAAVAVVLAQALEDLLRAVGMLFKP